ncbi:MAG: hypothetical protein DWQ07_16830 [Chloroflexi bacterium]|nr:MAG: hypothetical protein DWQ07_16830 [Chloroflexota bacterium]MBL1195413.1 hypothetical protein [Chloroflexota bacterium]NOH12696.1 hypothetical protein [Chloroflexota bacterium]
MSPWPEDSQAIPTLVVHNYLETFHGFLSRTGDDATIWDRRFNGDHGLWWLGREKLLISTSPIGDAERLSERWGYVDTHCLYPDKPSFLLSQDILNDGELLERLLAHAGPEKKLALVPYASTPEFLQLSHTLETEYGLNICLPESPTPENLWLKDYLDSKVGFRVLVHQWLDAEDVLPFGFICHNVKQAAEAAKWFKAEGKGCVVKANQGGSGVGNLFLSLEELQAAEDILGILQRNAFMQEDLYVVEEIIPSRDAVSPSLEFYVPAMDHGKPVITYLSNQHFEDSGRFAGVILGKELFEEAWYEGFEDWGLTIAAQVQALGYVGHFDLDAIVGDDGHLYLVEINARRTGGTYVHEFLMQLFGPDYLEQVAVFSQNKLKSNGIADLVGLENAFEGLLYPIDEQQRGVILTLTSALEMGSFGYLVVGENIEDAQAVRQEMLARLA